ncbi:MAG: FKBP-type peptidyl-prolyl cis-trans isomerase [Bacteroidales bacterium]
MANRRFRGSAGNNKKRGQDFLIQNAHKNGIIETDSGLQYTIVDNTNNNTPTDSSYIQFHQRVLLLNGTILEDTYKTNKPAESRVSELLEGLSEGIKKMPEGSRYKFWVPPDLAWGQKGSSDRIPPNAVIQFDIRLLEISD